MEFGEDGSREDLCLEFVVGLLLFMSPGEGNIFPQINLNSCFSTVLMDKSILIIGNVQYCLNFLFLCWDEPLEHGFKFRGIHFDYWTVDDMH